MDFLHKTKDIAAVNREIDDLQKYLQSLLADKEVLLEDLAGYELPEYEHFKERVLSREKIRLAMKRMTIPTEDQVLHDRIQGQFNEVELLERKKGDIERFLAAIDRKISESLAKIEKLKKQLRKQTERN